MHHKTPKQDTIIRCQWCADIPELMDYHDKEWGFPVDQDYPLFEKICLESFQSGLSWRTILLKRDNFRAAFKNFNFNKIARFNEDDINRLMQDKGIVRHKGKITAVINNARKAQALIKETGSLAAYFWQYEAAQSPPEESPSASTSTQSIRLAKDLKKRGWKFVGPTTIYAFMQAMGLVNDHSRDCIIRTKVETARNNFIRP